MDRPEPPPTEWLTDEFGDEYRLDAGGERQYQPFEWGEDAEADAVLLAEIKDAYDESFRPDAVFIDHEVVKRESRARIEAALQRLETVSAD